MGVADPLLLKKLFTSHRSDKIDKDVEFTRCVVNEFKESISRVGENILSRQDVIALVEKCHRTAYGKNIGAREEPKFIGDLDRLRVLLGVRASKHGELIPEFRVARPDRYKLNPSMFNWSGEPKTIATLYVTQNLIARSILNEALARHRKDGFTPEEMRQISLEAIKKLSENEVIAEKYRDFVKHLEALENKLQGAKGAEQITKYFVLPISRLSGNTLISYQAGRIILTEELRQLLRPEETEIPQPLTPQQILDAVLRAYIKIIREMLGIEHIGEESGIPLKLDEFSKKLAAILGVDESEALEYIRRASQMCPQGVIIEEFDVLHVSREPQVYIIPALIKICKSG